MSRIYLSPPHMSPDERELLLEAFDSNWIAPLGPHVDAFERELAAFVGVPYAAALSSGTAALHLALLLHGIGAGDSVLCSTFTFAATANAIRYVGAEPVFVDATEADWCMDIEQVERALAAERARGKRVKAVMPVDLYGLLPDLAALEALCEREGLVLIEDAAEALGSRRDDRSAGSFGACAAFSFNGNKIITTSGGGMLVSHDAGIVERARYLSTQAREPFPHYEHVTVGFNYRLSNLLAAVGRGQLMHLPERIDARRANAVAYREALADVPGFRFMPEPEGTESNHWLTCVLIDPEMAGVDREAVREHLAADQIEARPLWKPMHLQPVFADCPSYGSGVSERLFAIGLCLPSGSSLTDGDRARVIDRIRSTPGLR
ncbi:MAG: aminotransferase class I/II-fold pyridoxal phosphate-dependent enzyme [Alphaproteobacteria bacterium]|nr:aminotransferase class I/II-fold pyridoxal phosphate-dependent enzyme [Alphaproteobacteria bacterium]MCB9693384.1 aminotransferase class I/II-fold pyridoxal phosphate-dependent enzyme [Alphaproteobacteria bacterium]